MESASETIGAPDSAPVPVRILAALSLPRLGFTDPLFLCMQLVQMQIEVRKHSGAFWEQSLSQLLYAAVDEGFDYVLTVDYDSVFRAVDVWHMLKMMVARPDAAAIFPVQYRREADQLLLGVEGGRSRTVTTEIFTDQLTEATVGHFGLTFIRVSALKTLPHPWLRSEPNAEGKWGEGRVDADIAFWNKMRVEGHRIFCASRVVLGHLQQMITWPGPDYQPVHQYVAKYFGDGDAPPAVIDAAAERAGYRKPAEAA
jgi:hypothetical protein